ncbi:hypothetical protein [Methylocystis sp.]|jgi:hypothetical protein|uniref:hypothetical protein n=1 Tax=Methylocystis sp. TaxID=1911079 RepID=UPI003DA5E4B5
MSTTRLAYTLLSLWFAAGTFSMAFAQQGEWIYDIFVNECVKAGGQPASTREQFLRGEKRFTNICAKSNGWRESESDDAIIVPAGARHNVINTGEKSLKLYTIYGPPDHRDGIVRATKTEAEAGDEHFDGKTTE